MANRVAQRDGDTERKREKQRKIDQAKSLKSQGLNNQQIADVMGLSVNTINNYFNYYA